MKRLWLSLLLLGPLAWAEPTPDYVKKQAISLPQMSRIAKALSAYRWITVGEVHGTQEAPAFALNLAKALGKKRRVVLGVEIPQKEQALVDRFRRTKFRPLLKTSSFFVRGYQDGRSSEAMVKLLETLPNYIRVVCFDSQNGKNGQERDKLMALNLIHAYARYRPKHFVVLTGNVHGGIEIGIGSDPAYLPMSYFLHSLPGTPVKAKDIGAVRVRSGGGSIWTCMSALEADCKVHEIHPPVSVYLTAVSLDGYFLPEPLEKGYNGTVFFKKLSPSLPAFK